MALKDYEAFCREKLLEWDPDLDTSPGSPIDTKFIQPLLGRIGTDPFSTNLPLFVRERLAQEFPELALKEGDALIDLLVKGSELLLDPLARETNRIALSQSFRDPNLLTTDEAEALGANLFSSRSKGDLSRVTVRVYFSTPRSKTVTPADYALSKTGLLFYPTSNQSIKSDEMLFNQEGSDFYFDVACTAESPGDQYNIGPGEIVSMPTVTDASRVTNKARASGGIRSETAPEFVGRAEQELSEKSLNTIRGIVSKLTRAFPELTRVAVVGYRDPEMNRDKVTGGGVGSVMLQGKMGNPFPDGKNGSTTLRMRVDDAVDFRHSIASPGPVTGFSVTLVNAWGPGLQEMRDLDIAYVLDDRTLELVAPSQIINNTPQFQWAVRRRTITLSNIPGGIIFPDGPTGTVSITEDSVHIGGCTDIYVKGAGFDPRSLTINDVSDDQPMMRGMNALAGGLLDPNLLALIDFWDDPATATPTQQTFSILENDPVYQQLKSAVANGYVLDIIYPAAVARKYKITRVHYGHALAPHSPVLEVRSVDGSTLVDPGEPIVWKIQDDLDVELTEPREQKWEGYDLNTYIGTNLVDTSPTINFDTVGVAANDVLRILNGNDKGDHLITVTAHSQLVLAEPLKSSASGIHFIVFRPNAAGGLALPLVRVTSVDLLDSNNQPMGSTIPFGNPVFCRSEQFTDAGIGAKAEVFDAALGVVGRPLAYDDVLQDYVANVGGKVLRISWLRKGTLEHETVWEPSVYVLFAGAITKKLTDIVAAINAALTAVGAPSAAYVVNENRLGIAPIAPYTWVDDAPGLGANSCYEELFGDPTGVRYRPPITSRDIRSDYLINQIGSWEDARLDIDYSNDTVDVATGVQIGQYALLRDPWSLYRDLNGIAPPAPSMTGLGVSRLLVGQDFNPEAGLHVKVGERAVGWARLYFLEPVTIEFGSDSRFAVELEQGGQLSYEPNPWMNAKRIPAYPDTGEAEDGHFLSYDPVKKEGVFKSQGNGLTGTTDAHFLDSGITSGDIFTVKYRTIKGGVLPDPVVNIGGKKLIVAVNDSTDMIITFENDPNLPSVTRQHVADQINRAVGLSIAYIAQDNKLALSGNFPIVVRTRAGNEYANFVLGFPELGEDTTNYSRDAGTYLILQVTSELVGGVWEEKVRFRVVDKEPVMGDDLQHFTVWRPGTQRISSTAMANNATVSGLYYFDVQLAGRGIGNLWIIPDGTEMKPSGFFSYGYTLYSKDANLTFSMAEKPWMGLPAVYFPVGTTDDLSNSVNLIGQNMKVNYDSSALIEEMQNYVLSETDRVTCYSPLVRHLVPFFTRLDVGYAGGSKGSLVQEDAERYIRNLYPSQSLDSANVQKVATNRGATTVDNPVDVMAVVHNVDRSIWMEWSQDRINTGRLAAFFPDITKFTRRTA